MTAEASDAPAAERASACARRSDARRRVACAAWSAAARSRWSSWRAIIGVAAGLSVALIGTLSSDMHNLLFGLHRRAAERRQRICSAATRRRSSAGASWASAPGSGRGGDRPSRSTRSRPTPCMAGACPCATASGSRPRPCSPTASAPRWGWRPAMPRWAPGWPPSWAVCLAQAQRPARAGRLRRRRRHRRGVRRAADRRLLRLRADRRHLYGRASAAPILAASLAGVLTARARARGHLRHPCRRRPARSDISDYPSHRCCWALLCAGLGILDDARGLPGRARASTARACPGPPAGGRRRHHRRTRR